MERLVGGHFRIPVTRSIISGDQSRSGSQMYVESMSQQLLVQRAMRTRPNPQNVSVFFTTVTIPTNSGQSSTVTSHAEHIQLDKSRDCAVPRNALLLPNHDKNAIPDETGFPIFPHSALKNTRCALRLVQRGISSSECYRHDVIDTVPHVRDFPYPKHGLPMVVASPTQDPPVTALDAFTSSKHKRQKIKSLHYGKGSQNVSHKLHPIHSLASPFKTSSRVSRHPSPKDCGHANLYAECSESLHKQVEMVRSKCEPNIFPDLKARLKSSLMSGGVTQVSGPPMAGKSKLVDQVIQEMKLPSRHNDGLIYHSFLCERLSRLEDVFVKILTTLQPLTTLTTQASTETKVFCEVQKFLIRFKTYHHVFAFHKCEGLRTSGRDLEFLSFLSRMDKLQRSENVVCSIVFTTYKKFPSLGFNTHIVQVGFLTDPIDIKFLLEFHAPGVDVTDYIRVCQKLLCVPEAVIRFAEEYLVNDVTRCSPEQLEKQVSVDTEFLSMIFEKRLTDVDGWLSKSDLELVHYFGYSVNSTFTEENLTEFLRRRMKVYRFDQWVVLLLRRLQENHVLRPALGNRLAVHPLLVYYVMTCHNGWGRAINDQSCNSFTVFVCHVLRNAEENIRLHGKKGQVYGCLAQEWPHVRHVLELAINCTAGTYHAFLKVAIQARRLVMSCFPNESKDFYRALLVGAREYGTLQEVAVLEACLGHVMASGHEINWKLAEKYLDSAIDSLNKMGATHFYKWAIVRKAVSLYKQGDYSNSLAYFRRSKNVMNSCSPNQPDKIFGVSDIQKVEDDVTADIFQTVPMIFLGDNKTAREKLMSVLDVINDRCPNHPDLSMILNNIGLTEQRGNNDVRKALHWYLQAYTERTYLEKISPHHMVVPLNNVGMCFFQLNQLECSRKYLEKALKIQEESGGFLYYLALTKLHLGQVNFKQKNFFMAYEQTLEAEETLKKVTKHHDLRLETLMGLVHYRIVLRQSQQTTTSATSKARFDRTAAEIVDYTLNIGASIKERLSDQGQHYMMTAYEHGMVLSLGNSRDRFLDYKNGYLLFVHEKSWVRNLMASKKEDLALAAKHRQFYYYVKDKEYEDLDLLACISHMTYACLYCQQVIDSYSVNMWRDEVYHLMYQRKN